MVGQDKVVATGNVMLELFDGGVLKLLHPAALNADEMIVVIALIQFENRGATFEMMADDQAGGLELGQNPVDRGQTDFLTLVDEIAKNLLGAQVPASLPPSLENFQDFDAGQGDLQSRVANVLAFQG